MVEPDVVIRARRAVVGGRVVGATVSVAGGRIVSVDSYDADVPTGPQVVELADDEVLLPGLVDAHVHVNEPGRTDWEGFASATRAAAAGGVTTIIDMPLNSIPPTVTSPPSTRSARSPATRPTSMSASGVGPCRATCADLRPLHEAGVFGFKCFLLALRRRRVPAPRPPRSCARRSPRPPASTAWSSSTPRTATSSTPHPSQRARGMPGSWFAPEEAEERAIAEVIEATRETGARTHILHLSDADALPLIEAARDEGLRISVETCPHYLTLEAEEIPDGATQFKCCPPIREHDNRDRLWAGLAAGTIQTVVSDHSPCTEDLKRFDSGDFGLAWGGIAGLQLGLPAVWTEARQRGHDLVDVVRWMGEGPADQVGLPDRGRIAVGARADLVVFAPDEQFTVDVGALRHKNPVSAYAGRTLTGAVRQTWLHGIPVDIEADPRGRLLTRGQS